MEEKLIKNLENANCIRFLDYWEEVKTLRVKMTVGFWPTCEHPLAEAAREFHQKCIEYLKSENEKQSSM